MSAVRSQTYLRDLAARLETGLKRLPEGFCRRQARYIVQAQNADGGFAGRQGPSDPYYTSFAVRGADLLSNEVETDLWRRAGRYLRERGPSATDVVECFCVLSVRHSVVRNGCEVWHSAAELDAEDCLVETLERCRTAEGGYAKIKDGPPSLYHTFLAGLCYGLLGRSMPCAEGAAALVRERQCSDGGFSESPGADASAGGATNPTAAAIGLLAMLGALDEALARRTAQFVAAAQREDGGFGASHQAPVSDLMSTFTALVTLDSVGAMRMARLSDAGRFVQSLADPRGGFSGTCMDATTDVEYTYYGLGTLGLLGLEAVCACKGACASR